MAAALPILSVVGTAFQAIGAIQAGNAQAAQLQAQAQAQEYNARVQRQQAEAAGQQWNAREDLQRRQARQVMGQQLAATAESGVNLNGSASDLFRQSLINAETDALNVRYDGEMDRIGLLNQAQLSTFEAGAARSAAKSARTAGYLSAAGALATGAYAYSKMNPSTSGGKANYSLSSGSIGTGLRSGGGVGLRVGGGTGLR